MQYQMAQSPDIRDTMLLFITSIALVQGKAYRLSMKGAAIAGGKEVCCSMQVLACLPCFKLVMP